MISLNKRGFTLIELLAVITIIGILMLLAIPSVSSIIENSRSDTFVTNAKTYANAAKKLWTSDSLYCGSEPKLSSAVVDGDYYILIDTTDETLFPLLESGGKSPWGNRDVKGYIRIKKSEDGKKTKYYIALTDGIHAIYDDKDNPVEVDLIKRQDVIRDITADVEKLKNIETIPFERGKYTTCSEESLTWTGTPIKIISGSGIEVEDEICIENECFYVIGSDENSIKLFAKYNLYVGGEYDITTSTYRDYGNEATGRQHPEMRGGYVSGQSVKKGVTAFADSMYWPGIYLSYAYDNRSKIYNYIENYKSYLVSLGLNVIEARVIKEEELKKLRCYHGSNGCYIPWVYYTSFWTGSVNSVYGGIFIVKADRTFWPYYYYDAYDYGVRPVIVVPKSQINS